MFDRDNPRLMTGDEHSTVDDVAIVSAYREIAALDELVASIYTNKYLDLEPLIVIGPDNGPFTVLEGNRRLAAIKVLQDRQLAQKAKVSVPQKIPADVLKSLEAVTCYRVAKATDAEAFIGFKHINGPHRWDAYAKAQFVATWYRRERSSGLTIDRIAFQTGDTNNTIRDYIGAIFVLEQAQKRKLFDISNRSNNGRFAFSHLYTALGRKEYLEFLGLESGWNAAPSDTPIKKDYLDNLEETLLYLYGSKTDDKKSLIESQNPDLRKLGMCLVNSRALTKLRNGATLTVSYAEIDGAGQFNEALVLAESKLDTAMRLIAKYDHDPEILVVAEDILQKAQFIYKFMSESNAKSPQRSISSRTGGTSREAQAKSKKR
ncbi:ParB/Srx family N-terminal domain-containing protein [Trinickia sp. YCB016]